MPPCGIVKAFNELKDVGPGFVTCTIMPTMNAFPFERREKAFGDGVVPHIARATHAARDANLVQEALKLRTP